MKYPIQTIIGKLKKIFPIENIIQIRYIVIISLKLKTIYENYGDTKNEKIGKLSNKTIAESMC